MPTRRPAGEYGGILLPLFMGTRHFFPFRGNTIDRNAVRYWRPGELAWPSKRPRKQKILRERDALLLRFPGMCTRLLETMQLTGRDNQEHPFSLEKKEGNGKRARRCVLLGKCTVAHTIERVWTAPDIVIANPLATESGSAYPHGTGKKAAIQVPTL